MKNFYKDIPLNAETLHEHIEWLENGTDGDYATNEGRTVNVMEWSNGRYELVSKNGDSLTYTDDVFKAVWFLKTGEWTARNGKLFVDESEVESANEDDDTEEWEDYEPSSDDLEMGFNPYMGCYDYDC